MKEALTRDPVDAAVLARLLAQRVQDVVAAAQAGLIKLPVILDAAEWVR